MSLDDIEKKLYESKKDRNAKVVRDVKTDDEKRNEAYESPEWKEDEEILKGKVRSGKIAQAIKWIFALGIAGGIVAGGVFFALRYGSESKGVEIDVQGPSKVARGVPFEISVHISNDVDTFVKNGSLSVVMTQGLLGANAAEKKNIITEEVGDLGGGSLTRKSVKLFAVGETNSVQKVTVRFSFSSGRSDYEIEKSKEITIGDPAISIDVEKPDQVSSGSKFNLKIKYKNVSEFDFSDIALEVKYPPEYHFSEASYTPASLNNFWRIGEVKAGSEGSIQITGNLDASEKNSFDFISSAFVSFGNQDHKIAEKTTNVFIAPSPIVVTVKANGSDRAIARPGDRLSYVIQYENKSGISLADVIVEAKLESDDVFKIETVRSDGTLDSRTNTIIWNASRVPELALLSPGAKGEIQFSVDLVPTLPVERASDKNFVAKMSVKINSPSVPYYISGDTTTGFGSIETKIAGVVTFERKAFHRDALAQIINTGKLPPKVNQATQYTVHWIISNYGSDVRNMTIRSFLQGGVRWTGVVKSNVGSVPEYNPRTQEIVWNLGKIQANRGLFGDPVEVIFQIEAVPNITDVGSYQHLVGPVTYAGIDDFTGTSFSGRAGEITTSLPDDETVSSRDGIVIQ